MKVDMEEISDVLWRTLEYIQQPEGLELTEVELKEWIDDILLRIEEI